MNNFEINANLSDERNGVPNFVKFVESIIRVRHKFIECFGIEIMEEIPLLIDNGTEKSGYTPIITPVWKTGLIMKLNIVDGNDTAKTIYQSAHEFTHYVFYSLMGFNKPRADNIEESFCSAASLIILKELLPGAFSAYAGYVSQVTHEGYRRGLDVAIEVGFDMSLLKQKIERRTIELKD